MYATSYEDALLGALSVAVALADAEGEEIQYENARFRAWFPPPDDAPAYSLWARLPAADAARARERLARGRPYRHEAEVQQGGRALAVQVELRPETLAGVPTLVIEAQSIAKQKEAEYMLDSYSRLAERQTRELKQEKERVEKLLLNIMPRRIYEELRDFGTTTPQSFDSASVLMLDFAGFTDMAVSQDASALIAELNDLFTSFDRIIEHFRCERIKTIGDAYMAVSGMPDPDPEHAIRLARAALRMRRFLAKRNANSPNQWRGRIGIACGPAIGSIVGVQKYVYDIFGPAVNLAARLEQMAAPGEILVCADMCERLQDEFVLRPVGEIAIRGFGTREVFALEDERRGGLR